MSKTVTFATPVTTSSVGNANNSTVVTIDAQGRLTSVAQTPITLPATYLQRCTVYNTTGTFLAGGSISTFNTVVDDPLAMFNGTNTITIPVTGTYVLSHRVTSSTTAIASRLNINFGTTFYLWIGTEQALTGASSSIAVQMTAGDTVRQECYAGSYTQDTTPFSNMISVARVA